MNSGKLAIGPQVRDFLKILGWVTPPRSVLLGLLMLLAVAAVLSLLHPLLAGAVTAALIEGESADMDGIIAIGLLWVLLLLVQAALQFGTALTLGNAGEAV